MEKVGLKDIDLDKYFIEDLEKSLDERVLSFVREKFLLGWMRRD